MDQNKEKDLLHTYKLWVDSFMEDSSVDLLDSLVSKDIMGFGTTTEERVFGIEAVKALCRIGHEQRRHLEDYKYKSNIIKKQYSHNTDTAVIVSEIDLSFKSNAVKTELALRISTVLFYEVTQWRVMHWHGSVGVETDGDTWHQDEWKRDNERLQKKVDEQTLALKTSLENLKSAQAQLIQSEKMASLGELTAGIAHEIQNPLNFVNNFAEVSNELIDEIKESRAKSQETRAKTEDDEIEDEILEDIKQNLEKINHHGKRADSIVKGMLQHSRTSGNKKEPTDINALADEYFRLAYHGLRAKDKSFNAHLVTDYDESLQPINVIPQDIGRVILNLFTNAFYAVDEKQSNSDSKDYKPTVSISTKKLKDAITITVRDNGNGIPKEAIDKIFQPFFTTKPTGKGTGLGLSMSYDIIKAHLGAFRVETKEGESTTFTIELPLTATKKK